MSLEVVLVVTTSIMSVVGIGSVAGMVKAIKSWGSAETNRSRDIKDINDKIGAINHMLNNGGLVREIKTLQLNCGSQMTSVQTMLEAHMDLPGHGDIPERVAELGARVSRLEDRRK
jgi:hypothetical protein